MMWQGAARGLSLASSVQVLADLVLQTGCGTGGGVYPLE